MGLGGRVRKLLPPLLRPGFPDEARRLVQEPVLREALASSRPAGRCLNAGCGEGLYSAFLESYGGLTEIVNMDLELPHIAERRSDGRNTDVSGSLTEIPLPDRSLGFVLCTEVIEHVPDDRAGARELGRVLEPGGLALISVPTPPAPPDPEHVREGYTLDELTALLADGSLEVLWHRFCFHQWMRWLLPTWRWQYVHLGRGRRSLMPRLAVRAFAWADRALPFGKPWDLVVLARRS